jgi:hypothetical protein
VVPPGAVPPEPELPEPLGAAPPEPEPPDAEPPELEPPAAGPPTPEPPPEPPDAAPPGVVAGVTELETPEKALAPAAFTARTQKAYRRPLLRPVMVSRVAEGPAASTSMTMPVAASRACTS